MEREAKPQLRENPGNLWLLFAGPSLWFAHFLFSYVSAAVWCARFANEGGSFNQVRLLVAGYTLLALAGIAAIGWRGYRHHQYGSATLPHDEATAPDRYRFLGFATLLLCCLSFVATIYVALAAVFIGSCR